MSVVNNTKIMKKKLYKSNNLLSELSISEFDFPISINSNNEIAFTATLLDKDVKVLFVGILYFNFSTDDYTDNDTYCSVVEIEHCYRKLSKEELNKYDFSSTENIINEFFNIITIHCGNLIEVVCKDVFVE